MTNDAVTQMPVRQSPLEYALEMLQRAVALFCLVQGIGYWVRLLGFFEGPEWRFDLMPFYWQATAAPLAVLFPFAAVGLWMLASWGPVVWFLCAAAEAVMYGFFPQLFGAWPWLIVLHGAVAALYAVLRTLLHLARRRDPH
ncbi:DUF6163 family protein [Chelativorans alearense]|uniref:DUF6163 family protein n=1 Tax=Chelativorans alearense TaxID=2681495 RepID=UPI0013D014A2|nr:DUF6163 family protein [Chelativorans alearense]